MKKLFERVSSYWVRYDKYVIRTDAKGVKYITAALDARPQIIDPLEDAQTMVLEALNVGRLCFGNDVPVSQREAALLQFVHHYGLLGLMTALPTPPNSCNTKRYTCQRTTLSGRKLWQQSSSLITFSHSKS